MFTMIPISAQMPGRESRTRPGEATSEKRGCEQEDCQNANCPETTKWSEKQKNMTSAEKNDERI